VDSLDACCYTHDKCYRTRGERVTTTVTTTLPTAWPITLAATTLTTGTIRGRTGEGRSSPLPDRVTMRGAFRSN
jgi:hypothetical protein